MVQDYEVSFKWFIVITFLISWVSFGNAILYAYQGRNIATSIFYLIGALGPIVAFLSLLITYQNKQFNIIFWKRVYNPRIGPMWLVLSAIITPIILNLLPVLFSISSGTSFALGNYLSKHGFYLVLTLGGVIGWYGYAFPLLYAKLYAWNKKLSLLFSGLILGAIWSLWFLPIAFIVSSYNVVSATEVIFEIGVSFDFWEFMILLPFQSVVISWVYEKINHSTFVVIIFYLADITLLFFNISLVFQIIRIGLWILLAAALIVNDLYNFVTLPGLDTEH